MTNISNNESEEDNLINSLYKVKEEISNLSKNIALLKESENKYNDSINELEETRSHSNSLTSKKERELNNLNIMTNRIDVKLDSLLENLTNDYNMTYEFANENYKLDMDIDTAKREVLKLKDNISILGNVNLDAPEEYEKAKERLIF